MISRWAPHKTKTPLSDSDRAMIGPGSVELVLGEGRERRVESIFQPGSTTTPLDADVMLRMLVQAVMVALLGRSPELANPGRRST